MNTDVECALADDPDLLGNVMATVGKGKPGAHEACPVPES
jgi:hypothetical protein